jgi:hypothetical protein
MPISTHKTLEDVEPIETANRGRSDLALIVDRNDLTWKLRMDARTFLAIEPVGLGQLTGGTRGL